jgi:rRNA maturation endonuclease Nob1
MEKVKRIDGAMSYHRYCSKCHRLFLGEEMGCNFCANCGHKVEWNSQKLSSNFQHNQKFFEDLYKVEIENNVI